MTYDLHNAIGHATNDALTDLKRDGLDDLTNPHAQEIISEHARNVVPVDYGHLLDLYINYHNDLEERLSDAEANAMYETNADPMVNYNAIMYATHQLALDRMLGYLQDLIHADVD
jgi:hypothetical protein